MKHRMLTDALKLNLALLWHICSPESWIAT